MDSQHATPAASAAQRRWALLDGQEALDAIALGGALHSIIESAQLSRMDQMANVVRAAWMRLAEVGGAPATAIQGDRESWIENFEGSGYPETQKHIKQVESDPFWVSFVADRKTNAIFAILAVRQEEALLFEQRRASGRVIGLRASMNGEPFESIRKVEREPEALAAFKDLCDEVAKGEGDGSLAFALAAWEADQIGSALPGDGSREEHKGPQRV